MGEWQGLLAGFTLGATHFVFFGAYALALWYGSQRVADGVSDGGKVRLGPALGLAQRSTHTTPRMCAQLQARIHVQLLVGGSRTAQLPPTGCAGGVGHPVLCAGRLRTGAGGLHWG